jgi:acyl-CoA thioester hydrolase
MMKMSEAWPDVAGKIEHGAHLLPVRVYYEDTDFSGAVYHANYLKFCERGRSDFLRLLGIHHRDLHWHQTEGRMGFVVRRMVCDFLKPAQIDDLLEVVTHCAELTGARMELEQRVRRGETTLFEARVTVALVDKDGRPKRFPARLVDALENFKRPRAS